MPDFQPTHLQCQLETKSTSTHITDSCGTLETYSEIDKALADLNGNTRLNEDRAFLEGPTQQLAGVLFYGDTATNAEHFMGFAPPDYTTSTALMVANPNLPTIHVQ